MISDKWASLLDFETKYCKVTKGKFAFCVVWMVAAADVGDYKYSLNCSLLWIAGNFICIGRQGIMGIVMACLHVTQTTEDATKYIVRFFY
jgi:hypothetical protein